jgi:tetratricopeptide (TPR) repeat protein
MVVWPDLYKRVRERGRRAFQQACCAGDHFRIRIHREAVRAVVLAPTTFSMSRFVNLEFGGEHEDESRDPQKELVKDEVYYIAEAEAAFQNGNFESALRLYSKVLEFTRKSRGLDRADPMLIELGEFREAKLWADKALEHFPNEPELLAAKAVALGRSGDLQAALAFSDASIEERGDTSYIWLARGCAARRGRNHADYSTRQGTIAGAQDWLVAWLAGGFATTTNSLRWR